MLTNKFILIAIAFFISIYLIYLNFTWIAISFLVISILLIDYSLKNIFKNANQELDKAQGTYPEGKLKKYAQSTNKQITGVLGKNDFKETTAARYQPGKKAMKGAENFFSELKDIFK